MPGTAAITRHANLFTLPPLPLLTGYSGVPTIPQVHYSHNDVAAFARFCYGWEEVLGVTLGGPVLDDLHALVEFAQAGSIAGAAARLFRTPSAITRQLQRLE